MNIFCYPGLTRRKEVLRILGLEPGSLPEFGFMPRVPLISETIERTEIDMKLGNMLFEAKLTEGDFQIQRAELVVTRIIVIPASISMFFSNLTGTCYPASFG